MEAAQYFRTLLTYLDQKITNWALFGHTLHVSKGGGCLTLMEAKTSPTRQFLDDSKDGGHLTSLEFRGLASIFQIMSSISKKYLVGLNWTKGS